MADVYPNDTLLCKTGWRLYMTYTMLTDDDSGVPDDHKLTKAEQRQREKSARKAEREYLEHRKTCSVCNKLISEEEWNER